MRMILRRRRTLAGLVDQPYQRPLHSHYRVQRVIRLLAGLQRFVHVRRRIRGRPCRNHPGLELPTGNLSVFRFRHPRDGTEAQPSQPEVRRSGGMLVSSAGRSPEQHRPLHGFRFATNPTISISTQGKDAGEHRTTYAHLGVGRTVGACRFTPSDAMPHGIRCVKHHCRLESDAHRLALQPWVTDRSNGYAQPVGRGCVAADPQVCDTAQVRRTDWTGIRTLF